MKTRQPLKLALGALSLLMWTPLTACGPSQDDDDDPIIIYLPAPAPGTTPGRATEGVDDHSEPAEQPGEVVPGGTSSADDALTDETYIKWLSRRIDLAKVDCGCHANYPDRYVKVFTDEQCVQNWQRLLGDEQTWRCQDRLTTSTPEVQNYVSCLHDSDENFASCIDYTCPSGHRSLTSCLERWNNDRFTCNQGHITARTLFEQCGAHNPSQDLTPVLDQDLAAIANPARTYQSWRSLDHEGEESITKGLITSLLIRFSSASTFKERALVNLGTSIDSYDHRGAWAPAAGRHNTLAMSSDCQSYLTTRYMLAFQRVFLGHYAYRVVGVKITDPPYYASDATLESICR